MFLSISHKLPELWAVDVSDLEHKDGMCVFKFRYYLEKTIKISKSIDHQRMYLQYV